MPVSKQPLRMGHPIIVTFLILALIAFMYFAAEFLRPLVLSILLAFAVSPLTRFLERKHVPRFMAVFLSVVVVLGSFGGVGTVVWQQLKALTENIEEYQENIERQIQTVFRPDDESTLDRLTALGERVTSKLDEPENDTTEAVDGSQVREIGTRNETEPVQKVEVISRPSFQERLQVAIGPYLEFAAIASFVVVLVIFMLLHRDNLSERIIQLFGSRRISVTTRTIDEAGQRISKFLGMLAAYNAMCGLILGTGLWLIGIDYAVLWGFLAATLRFIPYVGPTSAFVMPLLFAVASSESWHQPAMVIALFGVVELISNGILEPILYGKTTGVSALGLLVAAMFWTWLWGPLGLLLSTPMTVCLAVLGKYVPSLSAFGTLLGEHSALKPDVRFYQKILALDQDGASEIVEEELKQQTRVDVFDEVLVPALSRAERDYAGDQLDEREQAFLWRVTRDILEDLDATPAIDLQTPEVHEGTTTRIRVLGIAANDTADLLALEMLDQAVRPYGMEFTILATAESALVLVERVADTAPDAVLLSHLPPVGLTAARYLVRRLHARLPGLPIIVGRWGEGGDTRVVENRLSSSGASKVVFSLEQARDYLRTLHPDHAETMSRLPGQQTTAAVQD